MSRAIPTVNGINEFLCAGACMWASVRPSWSDKRKKERGGRMIQMILEVRALIESGCLSSVLSVLPETKQSQSRVENHHLKQEHNFFRYSRTSSELKFLITSPESYFQAEIDEHYCWRQRRLQVPEVASKALFFTVKTEEASILRCSPEGPQWHTLQSRKTAIGETRQVTGQRNATVPWEDTLRSWVCPWAGSKAGSQQAQPPHRLHPPQCRVYRDLGANVEL